MTVDGLGFEESNQTVTDTATISGTNVYGSTSVNTPLVSATTGSLTTVNAVNYNATQDLHINAGSPYNYGLVIPMTARTIISGGQWVSCSGGKAMAAAVPVNQPLGVAQATCASGATCNVIVKGIVPMTADGTVTIETGVRPGAGAAGNTVQPYVAGSGARYATLDSAASGATVFVLL